MVFDHIGISVKDFPKAREFYLQALAPLGIGVIKETAEWAMLGRPGEGDLWIGAFGTPTSPFHVAFNASTREQVRQFHAAALRAGARDNGAPGLRPNYHANYFGAFVIDLDGHNIEAVCHAPEG
jgi:catechol 2,3-dioxygenase-like lactoylglutathione lyase family enzyme